MPRVQKWIYAQQPDGEITPEHYNFSEADEVLEPVRGEVLVEGKFWSVDPYMRIQQSKGETWERPHPLGEVQGSAVVGQITAVGEGVTELAIGDWVETYMGWRTYGLCAVNACRKLDSSVAPVSTALHVLGMPGRIAYFGLFEAGRPKPGETLVVSAAAGAVGSIVGQLGKIANMKVIGIVSSKEKASWITDELGFDEAILYPEHPTAESMLEAFAKAAPEGIDVYYDNTGGHVTDAVFQAMNQNARIVICGQISQYQGGLDEPNMGPRLLHHFLYKRAVMQGVLARDFTPRMDELLRKMGPWVKNGSVKYRETTIEGFEQLPNALCDLLDGVNVGKMVVKA